MSLENNEKNNQEFNEFLQSLQDDNTADSASASSGKEESFPFADSFDIDSFVKENALPGSDVVVESAGAEKQSAQHIPAKEDKEDYSFLDEYSVEDANDTAEEIMPENTPISAQDLGKKEDYSAESLPSYKDSYKDEDFSSPDGSQSIKSLQQQISELESRFEDANKEKSYYGKLQREIELAGDAEEKDNKNNDEFFKNISSTIDTLKGSLKSIASANRGSMFNDISVLRGSIENIVNARLQYEEDLISQDQNLIGRLRQKTNRLKSINLALNSEVKRSKDEKLEALRKSAEQTKELLSLRVQLNKVEEKARHGDFKLSKMEQHLSILTQEKLALDEEIRKVREEKLLSLRKSSEQTREIMSLRLALSKTEEKFKQEEIQNTFMREQLSSLENAKSSLEKEFFATRAEKEASQRELLQNNAAIEKLKGDIQKSQEKLDLSAKEAGSLREQILSLETKLQQMHSENAALSLRNEENIKQLEDARMQHEREIASLKNEQLREIELLKNQKSQETQSITLELRRAEDKYRQEETFVNTLKMQIESLRGDVASLEEQKRSFEGKSENLSRDIEFIKESHLREIDSLKQELDNSAEKLERERNAYQSLKDKLFALEDEKAALNDEIRKILSARDEALAANERYIKEIESLKSEHSSLEASLKAELDKMSARHEQDIAAYNELKAKEEAVRRENADYLGTISDLSARQEVIKRENSDYLSRINELSAREEAVRKENSDYISRISELSAREEAAKRQNSDYLSRISELSAREETARKTNAEYAAKIADLEAKREEILKEKSGYELQLRSKEDSYGKELEEYKRRIEALKLEQDMAVSNLTLEIGNLKKDHQKTVDSLSGEAASLRQENQNLSGERDSLRQANQNLSGERDSLRQANQNLSGERDSLRQANQNLSGERDSLLQEKLNLLADIDALKAAISGKEEDGSRLSREIESLRAELSAKHSQSNKLLGEVESLREAVSGREAQSAKLAGEIESLKTVLADEQAESDRLRSEIDSLKSAVANKDSEISGLSAEIESLKFSVSAKDAEISGLSGEISNLRSELEEQKRAANDLSILFEASKTENTKQFHEIESARGKALAAENKIAEISLSLLKAETIVKENESLINMLKGEASAAANQKASIDAELKRANSEKFEILKQLEEKTKALTEFQQRYEQEVSSLKETHAKAASSYEEKLKSAEERLSNETKNVEELKKQISALEQEKQNLGEKVSNLNASAGKIVEQTDEIINLRSKLAKAESRFLQDTVLVGQLKEQFSESRETVARLENEILTLRKENAKAKEDLLLKEEEIKKLTIALAKSEEQFNQEHTAALQLQEHTSKLKAINASLDEEVKKAQSEKLEALRKSADQAKEILLLRQKLSQAETQFSTLGFENGIISIRKEYEEKVEKLETELNDASALCAKQVKELEELKTDNSRLKSAEEEKLKLQSSYDVLSEKAQTLESELAAYKQKEATASTLAKAKAAALSAQIAKITREKASLKEQLNNAMQEIARLSAKEKETAEALNSLKAKISGNDAVIEKLKKDIVVLTAENRELKEAAQSTSKKERTLQAKIEEVEEENKHLVTSLNIAKEDAAKTEITLNRLVAERTRVNTRPLPPQAPQAPVIKKAAKAAEPKAQQGKPEQEALKPLGDTQTYKTSTHYDSSADAIAGFAEPMQELEEVEVEGNEMDLSMIFGDSDVSFKDENSENMATATNPDIEQVKATTINQPRKAVSNVDQGIKAYDQMEVTDHSIKAHGGVSRKPANRLPPTYRGSEAYSDFLKKTKSVFYRIKWSLFKE